ncbi:MAG: cupredoxin domain-containing protein [Candidatus Promineifilaceae bacterium]|nr:cupredoxin domain-containing protein [Candidatus Promineifilaceae bacterium]
MQAAEHHDRAAGSNLFQGFIIFFVIATASALFVIVLGYIGLLPLNPFGTSDRLSASDISDEQHVVTEDYRFAAEVIKVQAGETVRLVLDNEDRLPHSFDVDEWDLHIAMPGNKQVTAEFTPDLPGEYRFYCGLPGHVEAGMVGTLIVE